MVCTRFIWMLLAISGIAAICFPLQEAHRSCCTVIDINKDSGQVVIRSSRDGWIKYFKPDALEFAEINIGDTVDASLTVNQVKRVKGDPRSYPLLQPQVGTPCCEITTIAATNESPVITARTMDNDSLRFVMPDSLAKRFTPGALVYTSATHGFAMVVALAGVDSIPVLYGFPLLQREEE